MKFQTKKLFRRERERDVSNHFKRLILTVSVFMAVLTFSFLSFTPPAQAEESSNVSKPKHSSLLASVSDFFKSFLFSYPDQKDAAQEAIPVKQTESQVNDNTSFPPPLPTQLPPPPPFPTQSSFSTEKKKNNPKTSEDGLVSVDAADGFSLITVKPEITRREVQTLIQQSNDQNLALIRTILTAPTSTQNSDSLSVQQSLANLSQRISALQYNNQRQLDKPASIVTRSDSDISTLTNVTISNPTVTGTLTNQTLSNSGNATIGGTLTVTGATTLSSLTASTISLASLSVTSTTATSTLTDLNFPINSNLFYGGQRFLTASTTSAGNLTIGYQTATSIDANGGLYNTGVGYQALASTTSGGDNTAFGYKALAANTTGGPNVAIGSNALAANTTGALNVAIGSDALQYLTGNYYANVAVGISALRNTTSAGGNVAIGYQPMYSNISGGNNIAIGTNALLGNTTASNNIGIGHSSLYRNQTGTANTAVGTDAGYGVSGNSFASSTIVGYRAGYGLSTGSNNILIGYYAGYSGTNLTTGSKNIIIGYDIGATSTTMTNGLNIGNLIYGAGLDGSGTTLSSGNIGIGTTSPNWKLSVAGIGSFDDFVRASYFTATSTTATSTFAGDINIGSTSNLFQNGQRFLTSSTTAAGNLTIGYQSATSIDAKGGLYNTGLGYQAMGNATSTSYNTAVGYQALLGSATVSNSGQNTAVGYKALMNNSGTGNVAIGYFSMDLGSPIDSNVAVGPYSLRRNNGSDNIGLGGSAIQWNTTGSDNVVIGLQAGNYNQSATNTTIVGYQAARSSAPYNNQGGVYLGYQAGYSAGNNSDYNTLLGYRAGYGVTTGSNNIWLGSATSSSNIANLTIGSQNILIGNNISLPSATGNGQLNIGNLIYGTNITGTGTTLSTGNIGIGTTSPYALLTVGSSTPVYLPAGNKYNSAYVSGLLEVGGTGTSTFAGFIDVLGTGANATSTVSGNLWVKGTLRAATSYVGDLIFGNNFRFTEADPILTGSNALYLQNQFGSTALAIDENGNIGIGTTSPAYKLQVMGDIAATSFINTSTRDAKKDINYLTASQETDFLNKIKNTNIANYHYNIENQANPLRLGLIAEEAPAEILSVDGKGVDVYKMATFTLGGVKALQKEIEKMKIDLASLQANTSASSGTGSDGLFAWITDKFKTALGIEFGQGKLCLEDVCINKTQLKELLEKNNISQTSSSSSSSVAASSSSSSSAASSESSSSSESVLSSSSSSESSSSSLPIESSSSSETVSSASSSSAASSESA